MFPPELASLIPLVIGLLAPQEIRLPLVMGVPASKPGAITSLFFGPSGSQFGGTSSSRILADKARPPKSL